MEILKKIEYGILNDYYGALLTPYQSTILHLYYDLDSSLSEIAEEFNISRQGVRDVIVRASKKLIEFEERLGLLKKRELLIKSIDKVIDKCSENKSLTEELLEVKKLIEEI